jgi:hypothetical protein
MESKDDTDDDDDDDDDDALYLFITHFQVLFYVGKKTARSLPNICCHNSGTGIFFSFSRPTCLVK